MAVKSLRDNVISLFGKETELPPTPLDIGHLFLEAEELASHEAGIDLSGKPKVVFLIGTGKVGKTTFARWVAERSKQRDVDPPPIVVSVDPGKRDLALYHSDTYQPTSNNPSVVVTYLQKMIVQLLKVKRSAVIDFGAGDTALLRLLTQIPDLHTMLEEGGVEPVALHFLSPQVDDLTTLMATERAGFRPRATALLRNIGRTDTSKSVAGWFAHISRQPGYLEAVGRGAVEVWFPKLHAADAIEVRRAGFWAAINHAADVGSAPLDMIEHRQVSRWLGQMEECMLPIASWVDL